MFAALSAVLSGKSHWNISLAMPDTCSKTKRALPMVGSRLQWHPARLPTSHRLSSLSSLQEDFRRELAAKASLRFIITAIGLLFDASQQ